MAARQNVLNVFIASPGDLAPEREAIRDVAENINKVFPEATGWRIQIRGWEDVLPAMGRPQSFINPYIDACDLFIGMLWERWGDRTGTHSSGFEEEFDLVKKRRESAATPEICLLFKQVRPGQLLDSPQLQRVLEFKKQIKTDKQFLFDEFVGVDDFRESIRTYLEAHIFKRMRAEREERPTRDSPVASIREPSDASKGKEESATAEDALSAAQSALASGSLEDRFSLFDRVRLLLFSSAAFSLAHGGQLFGTHEANLAYRKADVWTLNREEVNHLLRSALAEPGDVRPAWRWLHGESDSRVDLLLSWIATADSDQGVRLGAIKALQLRKFRAPRGVFEGLIQEENKEVARGALNLFAQQAENYRNLDLIAPLERSEDGGLKQAALQARAELAFKRDPDAGIEELIRSGVRVPLAIKNALTQGVVNLSINTALAALSNSHVSTRRAMAEYLARNNRLTPEIAAPLLLDKDSFVRKGAVLALASAGRNFSMDELEQLFPPLEQRTGAATNELIGLLGREEHVDVDDLRYLAFQDQSLANLLQNLHLYAGNIRPIYQVLVERHFAEFAPQLRANLADDFAALEAAGSQVYVEKYGERAEEVLAEWRKLTGYIKASLTEVSLVALSLRGEQSDVRFARATAERPLYRNVMQTGILDLFDRFAEPIDEALLVAFAENAHGESQKRALRIAVRVSPDPEALLRVLSRHSDMNVRKFVASALTKRNSPFAIEWGKDLVMDENDSARIVGAGLLAAQMEEPDLEAHLSEYIEQPTYYYNVVVWLDRVLYAPGQYRVAYKSSLMRTAGLAS